MTKFFTISGILLLFLLYACTPNNTKRPDQNAINNLPKSGPADDELLETLQGRWQSLDDSTYVVEIIGNKMRHFNANQLTIEADIEINGGCDNTACVSGQPGSETDGWCFTEKDQAGMQCNVVTKCDKDMLHYLAVGSTGRALNFKRL